MRFGLLENKLGHNSRYWDESINQMKVKDMLSDLQDGLAWIAKTLPHRRVLEIKHLRFWPGEFKRMAVLTC
jgi:hypothetical protein